MNHLWIAGALLVCPVIASAQDQQLGARTKAMGGSYTAFEDDPVSVWLNPAGIATQPTQGSFVYQTYTLYPVGEKNGSGFSVARSVEAETGLVEPALLPSYLGLVFPLGDPESPMALGVCYARPYVLSYAMQEVFDPAQNVFEPESNLLQSFSRIRVAFSKGFRFRKMGEAGFFPYLALGLGADVGFEQWEFSQPSGDKSDRSTSVGFGAGLLAVVYDNTESLRVNFGAAYQSAIAYKFSVDPDRLPAFDTPQQLNAGLTFYLYVGWNVMLVLSTVWF